MTTEHDTTSPGHVLLVDGDENSRRIYSAILQHQGFEVSAVADCATALDDPGLIDVRVLLVDPFDCEEASLSKLRLQATRRGVPTLALTSRVTERELESVCAQGFDAILLKPIGPRDVAAAVRAALEHLREPRNHSGHPDAPAVTLADRLDGIGTPGFLRPTT